MRMIVQRVHEAAVTIDGRERREIKQGLLIYLALGKNDNIEKAQWLLEKCLKLRIFQSEDGKSQSLEPLNAEILLISQFTLYGNCNKGTRPSFDEAMPVEEARQVYEQIVKTWTERYNKIRFGSFQSQMNVQSVNDGPYTLILER